jgi:hypothetical protein
VGWDGGTGVGGFDGLRVMLWPPISVRRSRVVLCVSPEGALDFFKMGCRGPRLAALLDFSCGLSPLPFPELDGFH